MNYITVKLTEDQARFIVKILDWGWDSSKEDADTLAFAIRLRNKLRAEAKS